ncbi:hypothetical protein EJB05_00360, partial [Eragrostis curvula]
PRKHYIPPNQRVIFQKIQEKTESAHTAAPHLRDGEVHKAGECTSAAYASPSRIFCAPYRMLRGGRKGLSTKDILQYIKGFHNMP